MLLDHKKCLRYPVRCYAQYMLQKAPAWSLLSSAARHSCFTLSILLLFLRSSLNLWGEATHNPFSMKNSSSEKDKMKCEMVRTVSNTIPSETTLKRLPVWFFLFFFFSKEAQESLGNICFLSDSRKFSTESHFPPQRAKHLLHLDAITENENEKDQPPKHNPAQTPLGQREYQLHHFLHYSFSHYISSVFPSTPPPHLHLLLLTVSPSHRKAQLSCESWQFSMDVFVQYKNRLKIALLFLSCMVCSG